MAGPLVDLGDGGGGQAHGGDARAGAGAGGQVAGDGEGFRRQGVETHLAIPIGEEPPLGAVDAAGVVGQEASRASATPWSAARSSGRDGGGRGTIWVSEMTVMGKSPAAGLLGDLSR